MKVCFVGTGSIGKRHLLNLKKVSGRYGLDIEIHAYRETDRPVDNDIIQLVKKVFYDINEVDDTYDILFICNPTYKHYETINRFIHISKNMFIEKPIFDRTENCSIIPFRNDGIYYVAGPLKFSPAIKYIKQELSDINIYSMRAICSSYLPDWRSNIEYSESYSAKKEQGGGVLLDLIHEWDYLRYLFGDPQTVFQISGKYSDLKINSDDLAIYIANYLDKTLELHLDYFGRCPERSLSLYTDNEVILADIINSRIQFRRNGRTVDLPCEDVYENEMEYFINLVIRGGTNINTVQNAIQTMRIALGEV